MNTEEWSALGGSKEHRRTRCIVAVAVLLAAGPATLGGDSVRLDGFWIDNVSIDSMGDGLVVYTTATGAEQTRPLSAVQGIRLALYPELSEAWQAIQAGDDADAARALEVVIAKARRPWVKHYVNWQRSGALARAGRPVAAVEAYLELIRAGAEAHFLAEPPVDAVAGAANGDKQRIAAVVGKTMLGQPAASRAHLQQILDATKVIEPDPPQAPAEGEVGSAVLLPQAIRPTPLVELLRKGRFNEALEAINGELETPGGLSQKLYLKGVAQLALAERSGDLNLYKDAGISFMRVVIYFSHPKSVYASPSLLEVAYVHEKIGRPDLAEKLYERARILINEEDAPAYHRRMMQLIGAGE